ncbi:MAG: DNA-binding protein [Alphaproteobacteria bacterium]|jgi:excisionase family DNA binding protein|nr:DNA-binding protein [Alphaproteobacteria bacterium]
MTSHKPVRLLTPEEAADFLSVSVRTIKRLVTEGSVQAIRIRGSMRFRLEDLMTFIERSKWS